MNKIIEFFIDFLKKHQELILVVIVVVIGIIALIFGALGEIPHTKLSIGIQGRIICCAFGILLVFIGIVFFKLKPVPFIYPPPNRITEKELSKRELTDKPALPINLPSNGIFEKELSMSGFTNAFRSPIGRRDDRVKELIKEEMNENREFRLLAMSGYSYLHPRGPVWNNVGLGDLLTNDKAKIYVVLESPFSPFSFTHAFANNQFSHTYWEEKQKIENLVRLLQYDHNIFIRVTECPANCSLFLTSRSALYDFYLWSRPDNCHNTTENNFMAFEISKVKDNNVIRIGDFRYDCYELLEKHFKFLWDNGIPLEEFLHSPEQGSNFIHGKDFYNLYIKDIGLALNNYNKNNGEFKEKMKKYYENKTIPKFEWKI